MFINIAVDISEMWRDIFILVQTYNTNNYAEMLLKLNKWLLTMM